MDIKNFILGSIEQHRGMHDRKTGFSTPCVGLSTPDVSGIAIKPHRESDERLAEWIIESLQAVGVELPDEVEI